MIFQQKRIKETFGINSIISRDEIIYGREDKAPNPSPIKLATWDINEDFIRTDSLSEVLDTDPTVRLISCPHTHISRH